jgi:transcription elongation GreA/GreB family factor
MSDSPHSEIPPVEQQTEEWFMAQLAKPVINTPALFAALRALHDAGRLQETEQRIELLQDVLAERKRTGEALEALAMRARWVGPETRAAINWAEEASDILGGEWEQRALIDESGFARPIPPTEAIRRLRLLISLKEGAHVYDRTWGLGVVSRVDAFNKKVEIDFERRAGHQMSFSYAAESLSLVGDDHILMWKLRRYDDLRARVQEDPASVVRMALRSFGPLTVTQLQGALVGGIVPEPDWKRFWEQARKQLKSDPTIHLPSSRTEPLRLLEGARAQQDQWFDSLARERNIDKLIAALEEIAGRVSGRALPESQRAVLADRLAFALKGATSQDLTTPARLLMAADALGLADRLDPARIPDFFQGRVFDEAVRQLPARPLRAFLRYLGNRNAEALRAMLLDRLHRFEIGVLNEALAYLIEAGLEAEAAARFKRAFDARVPSLEMLSWLGRNPEKCAEWGLASNAVAALLMIEALEQEASGERLKAQNQLRERFAKPEWIRQVLGPMARPDREKILKRIKESTGWSSLDRGSVLGAIVKFDPSLAPLLAARESEPAAARGPVTSIRSFRERQRQLDRIVTVEIPKVAKDIAIARSYGDLRENHEYKSAKEAQALLFRRRDELMQELRRVVPSDFKHFPADKAGVATTVTLAYDDGRRETYHILGVWDGNPELGIISSTSRMAEALAGRAAGERLRVPSEHGEADALLESVRPLDADIQAWAAREDEVSVG